MNVSLPVRNTGSREGKEVVQLYVRDVKSSVERPYKELKAFRKIHLKAGEEKHVDFTVTVDDLKYFDEEKHDWIAEPGRFEILIGSSSADIRSVVGFELKQQ